MQQRFGVERKILALLVGASALTACGSGGGSSSDGAEADAGAQAGGQSGGGGESAQSALESVDFGGEVGEALKIGQSGQLTLTAHMGDGSTKDVTADAEWTSSAPDVLSVSAGALSALAAGEATITAAYEGKSATRTITVAEVVLTGVAISPQVMELKRGTSEQLTVTATFDDGSTKDVTAEATFTSSNPDVATVDAAGLIEPLNGGPVQITVEYDGQTTTLDATTTCDYPRYARALQYGAVMPPLYWEGAYQPDGSQFDFKLEDVYCDVSWKDTKVVFFIISAGWCTPCTIYAQRLRPEARFIEEAGGQIVIVESQTADFGPARNDYAQSHVDHIIGDAYAIRIGDHDTKPLQDFLHRQPLVAAFPTVIAIRTDDMQVITDSNHSMYYLPLRQIAEDPYADWSNPPPPPFANHCGEGDEEASEETNDSAQTPAPLAVGSQHGGICDESPDFYAIDLEGSYKVEVDFDASLGDIDVYVWDPLQNQPLQQGGDVVGSAGSTGHEEFTWQGPATIAVIGFQGASAPYDIKLTPQ
jgi:hypothetical protein